MTRPAYALDGVDTDALLAATGSVRDLRVRVVGGVGDVALALLAEGARVRLEVADAGAWALVHARLAALRELPAASARSYLGMAHFGRRVWFHHYVRGAMEPAARAWLDAREHLVREGLAGCGAWEQAVTGRATTSLARRAQRGSRAAAWTLARLLEARWGPRGATAAHVADMLRAPEGQGTNGALARRLLGLGGPDDVPAWLHPVPYAAAKVALAAGALEVARDGDGSTPRFDLEVHDADAATSPGEAPRAVRLAWRGERPLGGTVRGLLAPTRPMC